MYTKPQQKLLSAMRSGHLVHFMPGGGWRLFDGTPVNSRTVQSLARRGEIEPAANDLLDDRPVSYKIAAE